jgi:hypothetical protein
MAVTIAAFYERLIPIACRPDRYNGLEVIGLTPLQLRREHREELRLYGDGKEVLPLQGISANLIIDLRG